MAKVAISYGINENKGLDSTYKFIEKELSKDKSVLIGGLKKSDVSKYFWLKIGLTKHNAIYARSKAPQEFKIIADLQSRGKYRLKTNNEIIVLPKDKINVLKPKKKIDMGDGCERLEELVASIEIR